MSTGRAARSAAPPPVVIFAPGNGWLASDHGALLEDLASHGFIVIGLAPVGLSEVVKAPGGRLVSRMLGAGSAIGEDQLHLHADLRFVLQRLATSTGLSVGGRRVALNLVHVALVGHSVGGSAAFMVASQIPGIGAAVNLDGDPMAAVLEARPSAPLLLVSSEVPAPAELVSSGSGEELARVAAGLVRSEARRTADYARIASCAPSAHRVRLLGTRHLSFADAVLLAAEDLPAGQRARTFGPAKAEQVLADVRTILVTFLEGTMRSTTDGATHGVQAARVLDRALHILRRALECENHAARVALLRVLSRR